MCKIGSPLLSFLLCSLCTPLQGVENEIVLLKQTKSEREKELVVVQEELQQKKQIAGNTEALLTADNLQQYVKKIEVDHKKNTYTEFVF